MNGPSADFAHVFPIIFLLIWLVFFVIGMAIALIIWCKLFSKSGYHWAFGLLVLVPIGNLVMAFYLAFADWPVLKELRQLRQQQYPDNPPAS